MTLNGEITLILRYFAEFGSFQSALRKNVVDKAITTITMSSSKRLQRDRATPTV